MHATGLKYSEISNISTQGVLKHPPVTAVATEATVTAVTTVAVTIAGKNSKKINNVAREGFEEGGRIDSSSLIDDGFRSTDSSFRYY